MKRCNHPARARLREFIAGAILFLLLFALLERGNRYYAEGKLMVSVPGTPQARVEVFFDTGRGFTPYERSELDLSRTPREVSLPVMPLRGIKLVLRQGEGGQAVIEKAALVASGREPLDLLKEPLAAGERAVRLDNPTERSGSKFLTALHLATALLITCLIWTLVTLKRRQGSISGALQRIFFAEDRLLFWVFLAVIALPQFLWVLAYWPATATNDSWSTLRDTQIVEFTDWHPYIYTVYIHFLRQFAGSLAVVPIVQLLGTSALLAAGFWYAHRHGVRLVWLLPFIVLAALSIPIGLFNTILWKDVPFSIGIAAISMLLFVAAFHRRRFGRPVEVPRWSYPLLALLLVLLCHVRHNGAVFYLLLPILFAGQLSRRDYARLLVFLAVAFVTVNKLVPAAFDIRRTSASPYHTLKTVLSIATHYNFYSPDRQRDFRIIETATGLPWDQIKQKFPRQWFSVWDASETARRQWEPGLGFTQDYNTGFMTRLILNNIPIYLETRTYEFLHSIGLDQSVYDATTDYYENPLQLHGSNLNPPGTMVYGVSAASEPKSGWLRRFLDGVFEWSRRYHGPGSPLHFVWNLAPFYLLFALILFFERGWSPIGFFILPSLAASGTVFLVGAGESWRYFYYVYLCGLLVLPLYLAQRRGGAGRQDGSKSLAD